MPGSWDPTGKKERLSIHGQATPSFPQIFFNNLNERTELAGSLALLQLRSFAHVCYESLGATWDSPPPPPLPPITEKTGGGGGGKKSPSVDASVLLPPISSELKGERKRKLNEIFFCEVAQLFATLYDCKPTRTVCRSPNAFSHLRQNFNEYSTILFSLLSIHIFPSQHARNVELIWIACKTRSGEKIISIQKCPTLMGKGEKIAR